MTETVVVKQMFLDPSRCIGCRSCVAACRECDTHKGESMIYIDYIDRGHTVATSPTLCMHCEEPLAPCAQVCPAQAIFYGTYEERVEAGLGLQGAKPVNTFYFGRQRVRTRNYVVMTEEDDALDLMALLDEASLGKGSEVPQATAGRNVEQWVDAEAAGIPERAAPPQPWAPREPQPFTVPTSPIGSAGVHDSRGEQA
jgi:ferredoxin